jgi:hypothetical protein
MISLLNTHTGFPAGRFSNPLLSAGQEAFCGLIGFFLKVFSLFDTYLSSVFVFAESIIFNVLLRNLNIDGTFDVDNTRTTKSEFYTH